MCSEKLLELTGDKDRIEKGKINYFVTPPPLH